MYWCHLTNASTLIRCFFNYVKVPSTCLMSVQAWWKHFVFFWTWTEPTSRLHGWLYTINHVVIVILCMLCLLSISKYFLCHVLFVFFYVFVDVLQRWVQYMLWLLLQLYNTPISQLIQWHINSIENDLG